MISVDSVPPAVRFLICHPSSVTVSSPVLKTPRYSSVVAVSPAIWNSSIRTAERAICPRKSVEARLIANKK